MSNFLKILLRREIPCDEARRIARDACLPSLDKFQVYDEPQPGWRRYHGWGDEPCWYVTVPDDQPELQRTKLVVISRKSGKVLTVCSANNEG